MVRIIAVVTALLALPAVAAAQSDDPCFEALDDDTEALDRYDVLVGEYLDASAASDSARQVEVLDELIGICQANLRLYAFRANANLTMERCNAAEADYRHVLDNAESWPHEANASDARALAVKGLARTDEVCGQKPTDTANATDATDVTSGDAAGTPAGEAADTAVTDTVPPAPAPSTSSFVLGANGHGGVGWGEFEGEATEAAFGYGGGGQVFATYQFVPAFGLGLNADIPYWSHEDEDGVTYSALMPSVGAMIRLQFPWLGVNLWANYFFGTLEIDFDDGDDPLEADLSGLEAGLLPAVHIELASGAGLEIGPFFAIRTGTASFDGALDLGGGVIITDSVDEDLFQTTVGLTAQGVYSIGL